MDFELIGRTIFPLTVLLAVGFFAKRFGIFKHDEERILSYYAYYLALPAFLFVNIAQTQFTLHTFAFIAVLVAPIVVFIMITLPIAFALKTPFEKICSFIICTSFGSVAFYGVPFVIFSFPDNGAEHLTAISVAILGMVGLTITILFFELQSSKKSGLSKSTSTTLARLFMNPLMVTIVAGLLFSQSGISLWEPISDSLKMLGRSAAPVALVMLGAYLYGKKYESLGTGVLLGHARIIVLPLLALVFSRLLDLTPTEEKIAVLMNAMPLAISVAVFSQKYRFGERVVASTLVFSSVSAIIYLNIWLLLLN